MTKSSLLREGGKRGAVGGQWWAGWRAQRQDEHTPMDADARPTAMAAAEPKLAFLFGEDVKPVVTKDKKCT